MYYDQKDDEQLSKGETLKCDNSTKLKVNHVSTY